MRIQKAPSQLFVKRATERLATRVDQADAANPARPSFLERARNAAEKAKEYRAPHVTRTALERLEKLGPGDQLILAGLAKVKAGGKAELKVELEVERKDDGSYVAVVGAESEIGVSLVGEAKAGAGAALEFKFDTLEEAKRGVEALLPFGPDRTDALRGRLVGIALSADVSAKLEAKLQLGVSEISAELGATASVAYALNFEGDTLRLERTHKLKGKFEGELKFGLASDGMKALGLGGRQTTIASVEMTSGIEIPKDPRIGEIARAMAFVGDVTGLGNAVLNASTDVKIHWDTETRVAGNDHGERVTVSASDVTASDVRSAIGHALKGDVGHAAAAIGDLKLDHDRFEDHGLDWEVDVGVPGLGVEVRLQNELRDYEPVDEDD